MMYRNALQIHVPRTGTDVDVILAAVEEYLMMYLMMLQKNEFVLLLIMHKKTWAISDSAQKKALKRRD